MAEKNLQKQEIFARSSYGLRTLSDTILIPEDISDEKYKLLISLFNGHVTSLDPLKGVGYKITGDIHAGLVSEFIDKLDLYYSRVWNFQTYECSQESKIRE